MTEAFAATGAQVIPAFALVTAVPVAVIIRGETPWHPIERFPEFAAAWILISTLVVTVFLQARAFFLCLNSLRELPEPADSPDSFIAGVMMWSMVLLVVLPAVSYLAYIKVKLDEWLDSRGAAEVSHTNGRDDDAESDSDQRE